MAALALLGTGAIGAAPTAADLQGRIDASRGRDRALSAQIQSDSRTIDGFQGRIDDVRARLAGIQRSLDFEQAQLGRLKTHLRGARARLVVLQIRLAHDREVLAQQLVGQYESPQPDLVSVVLDAHGFADLLERVDQLKRIAAQNTVATTRVRDARSAVKALSLRLAGLVVTQQRVTRATLLQREEVDQLRYALVARQLVFSRARDRTQSTLVSLRSRRQGLEQRLARIRAREAAATATTASVPGLAVPSGPAGPFFSHGGAYGFFQASGTNYSVGNEPTIAARLDRLGKALHLHLIGVSGYRSPQHSVEVGGFANDPHTSGAASDTPGVEGVSEAALNQFGLTRPFGGAAEADHIQLG